MVVVAEDVPQPPINPKYLATLAVFKIAVIGAVASPIVGLLIAGETITNIVCDRNDGPK